MSNCSPQNEYINFSITAAICFLSHFLIALMASLLLLTLFVLLFAVSYFLCASAWLTASVRVLEVFFVFYKLLHFYFLFSIVVIFPPFPNIYHQADFCSHTVGYLSKLKAYTSVFSCFSPITRN